MIDLLLIVLAVPGGLAIYGVTRLVFRAGAGIRHKGWSGGLLD
jgi:hypothetical protein